jgi:hypothetical protein
VYVGVCMCMCMWECVCVCGSAVCFPQVRTHVCVCVYGSVYVYMGVCSVYVYMGVCSVYVYVGVCMDDRVMSAFLKCARECMCAL